MDSSLVCKYLIASVLYVSNRAVDSSLLIPLKIRQVETWILAMMKLINVKQ